MTNISRRALFGFAAALPFLGKAALAAPAVSGVATISAPVSGAMGGWKAVDGYTYVWMRDGNVMASLGRETYTLTEDDVGHDLSVRLAR